MIPLAKRAAPAAIAALRQATALRPKRKKVSDGLLPSKAHVHQNPNSDHNSGYAVDITHDIVNGIDCAVAFENLKADPRVKYLIFNGRIWSKEKGIREYTGSNPHHKHLHISIKETCGDDTSPWFPWLGVVTKINKVKAAVKPLPKKKESK
jgi:hypothetical protein